MEKRLITNATLEVLLDSNLIFSEKTFKDSLNFLLAKQKLELHEKTVKKLLKTLQKKDYIITEEDFFVKSKKTLFHQNNKQRQLFEYLVEQYKNEFDTSFIRDEYKKTIKSTEQPPAEHIDIVEDSFKLYSEHFNLKKSMGHAF